jgi:hypothetical protein
MLGLILGGLSILSGLKSSSKAKKAGRVEQQVVRLQNAKARQAALTQYRMARSAVLSGAVASGADIGSSGYQGIKGSLQSQVQEEVSFSLEQEALGAQANKYKESASKYASLGQAFSLGAGIAKGASDLKAQNPNVNTSPFRFYNDPGVNQ